MSTELKVGDWVRLDDDTYRVGQVRGTGYGTEVTVIVVPYGQVVTTDKVTPVPAPSPRGELVFPPRATARRRK
jgi:hypothetical protein